MDIAQNLRSPPFPQVLGPLDLADAPPVTRAVAAPLHRPKWPAFALLGLGLLLTFGPIVGGSFANVASGKQLLDAFEPHMEADALARYDADLQVVQRGAAGVDAVYAQQNIAAGRFPGLDTYRSQAAAIDGRATDLLDRVAAAEPDYRRVAAIGGFDRVAFLLVACGIVTIYGSCVLLAGRRERAPAAIALVVLAGAAIAVYPLLSDLPTGARAGERLIPSLAPVMTPDEVRQLQRDFVVLVHADGELDTGFRTVPQSGAAGTAITALIEGWPAISSDLATLVGTINDNISNYEALEALDALPRRIGFSGLAGLPWLLVGVGTTCVVLALAARPRRRKEHQ